MKMKSFKLFNQFKVMEIYAPLPENTVLLPDLIKMILDFSGLVRISHRSLIFIVYNKKKSWRLRTKNLY